MSLVKSLESVPVFGQGVKWFETEMHNTLFQHSVFGGIVFLIVSNTGVYKFVKGIIFDISGVKLDGNTLQLFHAIVFAVIMYVGSMYLFAPILVEGLNCPDGQVDRDGKCQPCPDGQVDRDGKCQPCPDGQVDRDGKCEYCPGNEKAGADGTTCSPCDPGQTASVSGDTCVDNDSPEGKEALEQRAYDGGSYFKGSLCAYDTPPVGVIPYSLVPCSENSDCVPDVTGLPGNTKTSCQHGACVMGKNEEGEALTVDANGARKDRAFSTILLGKTRVDVRDYQGYINDCPKGQVPKKVSLGTHDRQAALEGAAALQHGIPVEADAQFDPDRLVTICFSSPSPTEKEPFMRQCPGPGEEWTP